MDGKRETKRIFISDLPETATQDEIETLFKDYGNVLLVEIKERKELGLKNHSLFFAYINVETDDRSLQKCFKDFATEKWHGQYVQLQIARESFLDRLKRERLENKNVLTVPCNQNDTKEIPLVIPKPTEKLKNGFKPKVVKKQESSSESSSSDTSDNEADKKSVLKQKVELQTKKNTTNQDTDEKLDLIIKNNRGKTCDRNGLKIASVGKEPIIKIEKFKKKANNSYSEANLKRLQSLNVMKKGYQTQKSLIKAALSNVDKKTKNKIIFENTEGSSKTHKISEKRDSKKSLFDEQSDEEDYIDNFKVKEQFQGKKGQKLLELQSKYKNDNRFALDKRFLEEEVEEQMAETQDNEELSIEAEKRKEYEILEQVIGHKVIPKYLDKNTSDPKRKAMLRFDPSQPEHSKYEVKNAEIPGNKKRKRKEEENSVIKEKKREEPEQPEVSKEVFYKVTEGLKETFQEKQEFSLLSMFGKASDEKDDEAEPSNKISKNSFVADKKNPFRYDSSDDEIEDIPHKNDSETKGTGDKSIEIINTTNRTFWSESFFFKNDDYRLQEGFDFIEKIKSKDKGEFSKVRKDLHDIVRSKIKNNERKNKMFKNKLGGKSKRRKQIRIKKALKR